MCACALGRGTPGLPGLLRARAAAFMCLTRISPGCHFPPPQPMPPPPPAAAHAARMQRSRQARQALCRPCSRRRQLARPAQPLRASAKRAARLPRGRTLARPRRLRPRYPTLPPPPARRPGRARDERDLQRGRQHVEDHGRQDEVDAARAAVEHAVQRAGLALQVEAQVERVQVRKHAVGHVADRALRDLRGAGARAQRPGRPRGEGGAAGARAGAADTAARAWTASSTGDAHSSRVQASGLLGEQPRAGAAARTAPSSRPLRSEALLQAGPAHAA